jgi:hypothetical protein
MQELLPLGLGQTRYRRRVVASRPEIFGDQRFFESRFRVLQRMAPHGLFAHKDLLGTVTGAE